MPRTPLLSLFVKKAAQKALDDIDYRHVLLWVPESAQSEVIDAFEKTLHEHDKGSDAAKTADRSFIDTILRLSDIPPACETSFPWKHPLFSLMENAVESGNTEDLKLFLFGSIDYELEHRFDHLKVHSNVDLRDAAATRQYVATLTSFTQMIDSLFSLVSPKEPSNEIQSLLQVLKPTDAKKILSTPLS